MNTPIHFALRIGRRLADEAALAADIAATRAGLADNESLEGTITLDLPTGEMVIEDDLHAAIQNFCLLPIPKLLARQPATYLFFSYAGQLQLSPVGDEVELSGDFIEAARAPLQPLIGGLLACAERFIGCLRALEMPEHAETLAQLERHLAAALTRPQSADQAVDDQAADDLGNQ
jgi:hypothetical protein